MRYLMIGYSSVTHFHAAGNVIILGPFNADTDEEAGKLAKDYWKEKKPEKCRNYSVFREILIPSETIR